jgi:hypothetical protein
LQNGTLNVNHENTTWVLRWFLSLLVYLGYRPHLIVLNPGFTLRNGQTYVFFDWRKRLRFRLNRQAIVSIRIWSIVSPACHNIYGLVSKFDRAAGCVFPVSGCFDPTVRTYLSLKSFAWRSRVADENSRYRQCRLVRRKNPFRPAIIQTHAASRYKPFPGLLPNETDDLAIYNVTYIFRLFL